MVTVPPVVSYVSLTAWGEGRGEPQDTQEGDSVPQTSAFLRCFKRCMSISVLNPIKIKGVKPQMLYIDL